MSGIGRFIKREIGKMARDKVVLIYLVIFPALGLLAYGTLFMNRVGRDYPVAIVDRDADYGSRLARHYMESCPELDVVSVVRTEQEAREDMAAGRIMAAIVLPASLESDLKSRQPVQIDVLVDARNMVNANFIMTAMQKAFGFGQAGIKFLIYKKLAPAAQARDMVLPLRFHSHALGNPAVDYSFFVLTGILVMIIQQCLLVGSAVAIAGESEQGTLAGAVAAAGGPLRYLLRRQFIYTICQAPILLAVLGGYFWILRMPSANLLPLVLLLVLFVQAVVGFSQVLGALFRSRKALIQAAVFFSMPAFFLGGYTWPLEDMSPVLRPIAAILPTTPILNAWTTLTAIPDSLRWLGGAYLHQGLLAVLYFGLSWLCLRLVAVPRRRKATAA
ncbi:MAG: ABC transporter permease [Acidobacteriota bacterium]